jgi:hypothetical protein
MSKINKRLERMTNEAFAVKEFIDIVFVDLINNLESPTKRNSIMSKIEVAIRSLGGSVKGNANILNNLKKDQETYTIINKLIQSYSELKG